MKKFIAALGATTLSVAMVASSIVPVNAAPVVPRVAAPSDVVNAQFLDPQINAWNSPRIRGDRRALRREFRRDRREWRRDRREARREWRQDRRQWRRAARRGYWHDGNYGWYNGHRGYSYYRPGYRRYNDWWFPAAAFIGGAIVGGALASPAPVYRSYRHSSAHVEWCYDRYRSYRASDNTFQPYDGPRRQCYSPYS